MPVNKQKTMKRQPTNGFKPGRSGNPSGRPKKDKEAEAILKGRTPDAARKLVELLDSRDDNIALKAANSILDRVNGKAVSTTDINLAAQDGKSVLVGVWLGDTLK
jgi:hypothetical protein